MATAEVASPSFTEEKTDIRRYADSVKGETSYYLQVIAQFKGLDENSDKIKRAEKIITKQIDWIFGGTELPYEIKEFYQERRERLSIKFEEAEKLKSSVNRLVHGYYKNISVYYDVDLTINCSPEQLIQKFDEALPDSSPPDISLICDMIEHIAEKVFLKSL